MDEIFDTPNCKDNFQLALLEVPFAATTSFRSGAENGPKIVKQASAQVDLFDIAFPTMDEETLKTHWFSAKPNWISMHKDIKTLVNKYKANDKKATLHEINRQCQVFHDELYKKCENILSSGKPLGVIGGEHSISYTTIKATANNHKTFDILHIDAHHDLRKAYQGFYHSHASVFYNVIETIKPINKLISVGIRDYCKEEYDYALNHPKIKTFYDDYLQEELIKGKSWAHLTNEIITSLEEEKIYLSVDIDGLDPVNCPDTGTPVPGGLRYAELIYLIGQLVKSGKQIIGFDLVEVAGKNDSINAIIAAQLLLKMCYSCIYSNEKGH